MSIPHIGFYRLAESAFEQIRLYSRVDAAVGLRLMGAYADLSQTLLDEADRNLIGTYGQRLLDGLSNSLGDELMGEMQPRLTEIKNPMNTTKSLYLIRKS